MSYSDLLVQLGFSEEVIDAHNGKIKVPKYSLEAPFDSRYGFPPIVIPLWSDSSWPGYIGLVTNWFDGSEHGFVKYYSNDQYVSEIAMTFDQLKAWLTFDFLCNIPEQSEVEEFAESIGLCPGTKAEHYFKNCNDFQDLKYLDVFKSELPQFLAKGARDSEPLWIRNKTTKENVLQLIENKQFGEAWRHINSSGFSYEDTIELLEKIGPFSSDSRFRLLVDCWIRSNTR